MQPPVFLPGKNNAPVRAPGQLLLRYYGAEHTARPPVRAPDLPAFSIRNISHANCPGLARFARRTTPALGRVKHANERNLFAIGRPHGTAVVIDARVRISHGLRREIVDFDETVIASVADECELRAIGRPTQIVRAGPRASLNRG